MPGKVSHVSHLASQKVSHFRPKVSHMPPHFEAKVSHFEGQVRHFTGHRYGNFTSYTVKMGPNPRVSKTQLVVSCPQQGESRAQVSHIPVMTRVSHLLAFKAQLGCNQGASRAQQGGSLAVEVEVEVEVETKMKRGFGFSFRGTRTRLKGIWTHK